jgi:ribosomal protein L37AE/L43A
MSRAATEKSGEKNGFYGKKHSEATLKILKETQKRKVECPHCGKIGSISIMQRWHFDKCKKRA